MKYVSSRGSAPALTASEAIQKGLASDGGLYIPATWPAVFNLASFAGLKYPQFAAQVLSPFFAGDVLEKKLPAICEEAFDFPLVLKSLDPHTSLLELFHGPTNAFKDFGARFLAICMRELREAASGGPSVGKSPLVLVATSGDTGGAVASAFSQCAGIPVVILYPKGLISPRQEKQLTGWQPLVRAFAVRGNFDDCQKIVKEAFLSPAWNSKWDLISANSINLARLLPQMTYFAYASLQFQRGAGAVGSVSAMGLASSKAAASAGMIVPSGNLGNATAALWAQKMGFPISKVICAHNANKAVMNYFTSGLWQALPTVATLANAMDVGNPSNFERLRMVYPVVELNAKVAAVSVSDAEIKSAIVSVRQKYGEIICPHTATAFVAREKWPSENWILVATAHPAKFETIVEPLLHEAVPVPASLQQILSREGRGEVVGASLADLATQLGV